MNYKISNFATLGPITLFLIINLSFSHSAGVRNELGTENETLRDTMTFLNCEQGIKCVNKCCPKGTVLTTTYECIPAKFPKIIEWKPPATILSDNYTMTYGFPLGSYDDICVLADEESFYLKKNGMIFYMDKQTAYPVESYCIDNFYDDSNGLSEFAVICIPIVRKSTFDEWADSFHRKGLLTSAIIIFSLMMLNFSSPRKRDLHLNCLLFGCGSLTVAFVIIYLNMKREVTAVIPTGVCVMVGIMVQFTFLSFFFWLNIAVANVARMIRTEGILQENNTKDSTRLKIYLLYAYGCPFIIACVTLGLQYAPYEANYFIKPRIAEGRCWFADGQSVYAYFYGIEIFLHFINILVMIYCWRVLKKDETRMLRFRQMFWLVFMFIICWVLNALTLIDPHAKASRIVDILVSLQGLYLFIIVSRYQTYIFTDAKIAIIKWITCADRRRPGLL